MKCVWPRQEQFLSVSLGADQKISDSPFQLLLMSRIQCGDGAARTDAEDEEHKPFSHASPSSPCWRLPGALLDAPYPFEAGCKLCGDACGLWSDQVEAALVATPGGGLSHR
jgi:hypothetical protein